MQEFIRVVGDMSMPVQIGWGLWMVWLVGQAIWYRRARVTVVTVPRHASRTAAATRHPKRQTAAAAAVAPRPATDLPEFLPEITPFS
jgi:hypothetical protein